MSSLKNNVMFIHRSIRNASLNSLIKKMADPLNLVTHRKLFLTQHTFIITNGWII